MTRARRLLEVLLGCCTRWRRRRRRRHTGGWGGGNQHLASLLDGGRLGSSGGEAFAFLQVVCDSLLSLRSVGRRREGRGGAVGGSGGGGCGDG